MLYFQFSVRNNKLTQINNTNVLFHIAVLIVLNNKTPETTKRKKNQSFDIKLYIFIIIFLVLSIEWFR